VEGVVDDAKADMALVGNAAVEEEEDGDTKKGDARLGVCR
jgi:hypothetical protein